VRISAIVLAAGEGKRMKSRTPKALLPLAGRPLLLHSLETFASVREVVEIVLVLPPGRVAKVWKAIGPELASRRVTKVVCGGPRRQDSVRCGLGMSSRASDVVLVHDSARPFASADLVLRVAEAARRHGGAVAAVPSRDTVKRVDGRGRVVETPDRRALWCAQTPQGFRRRVLASAYAAGHGKADATDDAQIVERAGGAVVVVDGEATNLKITSREDLPIAEEIYQRLHRRRRSFRVSSGRRSTR